MHEKIDDQVRRLREPEQSEKPQPAETLVPYKEGEGRQKIRREPEPEVVQHNDVQFFNGARAALELLEKPQHDIN